MRALFVLMAGLCLLAAPGCNRSPSDQITLLNVSYDPTRELWRDLNKGFTDSYSQEHGQKVQIKQSHGASGSQARSVMEGLDADVVTLALWPDTNAVSKSGLIQPGWEEEFPNRSLPYTSTIVFVVRKGNPKGIKDWSDLTRPGIEVITPNPKTSGNGKLAFLGAWGSVTTTGGSEEDARKFVQQLYKVVPVLDTGARGATTTFSQKGIGDVHLTWESEAYLELKEAGDNLELVYPPRSILAEPHVAIVDSNVDRHNTRAVAEAYLNFAYSPAGQEIIAKHYYRPSNPEILAQHAASFPPLTLFKATDLGGDWDQLQQKFFADGGIFDQVYSR
ncbi:sulfate ABC transporter substrate-binding protein [Planctomicrobium sp. SH664]|uniref:sulfate ABC transporter substrate-binding protein n=1 Tax=Planctomicrobium sp. SH664 TaxID=3448125 RepID=UPI003F5BC4B1